VPVRLFLTRWRLSPSRSPETGLVFNALQCNDANSSIGVVSVVTPDEKEKRIRGREELRFDGLKDINTVRPSSTPAR
jgi:hypothetical protein